MRGKLIIFLRKLITETSHLIEQIEKDFKKNKKVMKKIERRMDQIDRDKKQREIKKNELRNEWLNAEYIIILFDKGFPTYINYNKD